ncbi:MAG: hypothetical protein AB7Y74_10265, partial [Syntrophorhabdus sp.]
MGRLLSGFLVLLFQIVPDRGSPLKSILDKSEKNYKLEKIGTWLLVFACLLVIACYLELGYWLLGFVQDL